ncbi:hypothetical protein MNBD_ALPHA09-1937 [hydrothermal vent metagenome]|uniref:Uncharacterized protein n=1 Tax=hydrothermal vent metagenome TaxID=652676 RepID=A0A3B0SW63_9ZZZZ
MTGALAGGALADGKTADSAYNRLFAAVLADPANADLGLEYARAALARGEPRKALSTYERILLQDPGNDEARVGLTRVRLLIAPAFTSWRAEAGLGASSNARHATSDGNSNVFARGALSFRDERRLGDNRWRTLGSVRHNQYGDVDELTAGLATISAGPMLGGVGKFVILPAAGVSYSWLDGRSLYFETFGEISAESYSQETLSSVGIRAAHRNIANRFSSLDAWVFDLKGRRSQRGLFGVTDVLSMAGRLRYSNATGTDTKDTDPSTPLFPGKYIEVRGKFAYAMPLFGDAVSGGPTLTAFSRSYRTPVSTGTAKDRRDFFFAPGAAMTFNDVCGRQCDVKFSYRFENNNSNDPAAEYETHVGGARIAVSF